VAARPPLRVVGPEGRVLVLGADPPDSAFLHEGILCDLTTDLSPLTVGAGESELAHPRPGTLAVLRDMNHVLIQKVFINFALAQPGGAVNIETAPYMLTADINTALTDLARRVGREELRGIVPLPFVAIEAIRVLQVLDGVGVLQASELPVERRGLG